MCARRRGRPPGQSGLPLGRLAALARCQLCALRRPMSAPPPFVAVPDERTPRRGVPWSSVNVGRRAKSEHAVRACLPCPRCAGCVHAGAGRLGGGGCARCVHAAGSGPVPVRRPFALAVPSVCTPGLGGSAVAAVPSVCTPRAMAQSSCGSLVAVPSVCTPPELPAAPCPGSARGAHAGGGEGEAKQDRVPNERTGPDAFVGVPSSGSRCPPRTRRPSSLRA